MYEDKTYEAILADMLARVPADLDRREGSVIWLALAPAAAELAQAYIDFGNQFNELFGDTASRPNLARIAADTKGIAPKDATAAVWLITATPSSVVLIGERFTACGLTFKVTGEGETEGTWLATCETAGTVGNTASGTMLPVGYINGLTTCALTSLSTAGEDEEDTEAFRTRWKQAFEVKGFGGNKADYKAKIKALDGVGGCKVYRAANASNQTVGGHVRCVIIASDNTPPSAALVASVQAVIDPDGDGEGNGIAPIGHICHIDGVAGTEINVCATYMLDSGVTFAGIKPQIEAAVSAYLTDLRGGWEAASQTVVRLLQIEAAILRVPGVADISGATINGSAANVTLTSGYVPTLGTITEAADE